MSLLGEFHSRRYKVHTLHLAGALLQLSNRTTANMQTFGILSVLLLVFIQASALEVVRSGSITDGQETSPKIDSALKRHNEKRLPCARSLELAGPDDSVAPCLSNSVATLIGTFKNRVVYFTTAVKARVSVKEVVTLLKKHPHNKIPSTSPQRRGFITDALQWAVILLLTLIIIFRQQSSHAGMQIANIGLDDGKGMKVNRDRLLMDHPADTVTWDLSDDDAHAVANVHDNRAIMSDELRSQMINEGHSNVTFLHHTSPDGNTPVLVYHSEDKISHFHWRTQSSAKEKTFARHYPFFDANGAGFKISAISPYSDSPSMSEADAKPIAHAIASDFLDRRSDATYVGYHELIKGSSLMGHKLCLIAEGARFALNNEIEKCFPKGP